MRLSSPSAQRTASSGVLPCTALAYMSVIVHVGDDVLGVDERGLGAGRSRITEGARAACGRLERAHRLVHALPHLAALPRGVGARGIAALELEPARILLPRVEP